MLVSGPWNSFQDTRSGTLPLTQCLSPYVCYVLAFEMCGMHQMCHNPFLEVVNRRSIAVYNGAVRVSQITGEGSTISWAPPSLVSLGLDLFVVGPGTVGFVCVILASLLDQTKRHGNQPTGSGTGLLKTSPCVGLLTFRN